MCRVIGKNSQLHKSVLSHHENTISPPVGSRKAFKKAVMSQAIGVRRWEMPDVASTVDSYVCTVSIILKGFQRDSHGFAKNGDHIPSLSTVR